jgi:hypothetical protein
VFMGGGGSAAQRRWGLRMGVSRRGTGDAVGRPRRRGTSTVAVPVELQAGRSKKRHAQTSAVPSMRAGAGRG